MCLIVFSYKKHAGYRLVFAANRDEFYERPTRPLSFWTDRPDVLAGRDLKGGGTWLGVTRSGRIAAITNFRDIPSLRQDAPTRGMLVSNFLTGSDTPVRYLDQVRSVADRYNGFNLIVGDRESLCYYSNKGGDMYPLSPGVYGLSNHLLDTPWPKVRLARDKLQSLLINTPDVDSDTLMEMLHDVSSPPDAALPDTGIGLEWERMLSPIFIAGDGYGTRSSSVLLWRENGEITFAERTFDIASSQAGKATCPTRIYRLKVC